MRNFTTTALFSVKLAGNVYQLINLLFKLIISKLEKNNKNTLWICVDRCLLVDVTSRRRAGRGRRGRGNRAAGALAPATDPERTPSYLRRVNSNTHTKTDLPRRDSPLCCSAFPRSLE